MDSAVAKFFLILSIIILEIASSYEKVGVQKWGLDFYISINLTYIDIQFNGCKHRKIIYIKDSQNIIIVFRQIKVLFKIFLSGNKNKNTPNQNYLTLLGISGGNFISLKTQHATRFLP